MRNSAEPRIEADDGSATTGPLGKPADTGNLLGHGDGARGSRLAQAMVAEFLAHLGGPCPVVKFKNRVVMTDGDRDHKSPLSDVSGASGSGAFSNQLEKELLEGRIDVAVHSLKDLPIGMPESLVLAVPPPRENVHDALCGSTLAGLQRGARVGTGSARRIAQLKASRTVGIARGESSARTSKTITRSEVDRRDIF